MCQTLQQSSRARPFYKSRLQQLGPQAGSKVRVASKRWYSYQRTADIYLTCFREGLKMVGPPGLEPGTIDYEDPGDPASVTLR